MEFIKEAGVSPQKSMDIKNDKITIKPLRDKDVDIFSKWLAKEYIYKMKYKISEYAKTRAL
jgi:hypothetical protein